MGGEMAGVRERVEGKEAAMEVLVGWAENQVGRGAGAVDLEKEVLGEDLEVMEVWVEALGWAEVIAVHEL